LVIFHATRECAPLNFISIGSAVSQGTNMTSTDRQTRVQRLYTKTHRPHYVKKKTCAGIARTTRAACKNVDIDSTLLHRPTAAGF